MITVILGAGADCDLDFPMGSSLIDRIQEKYQDPKFIKYLARFCFNNRESLLRYKEQMPVWFVKLLTSQKGAALYELSRDSFNEFLALFPSFPSIDMLIHYRKEYSFFAKVGIAHVLSTFERPEKLLVAKSGSTAMWYYELWRHLIGRKPNEKELVDFFSKKLRFVTFNYDRSLEEFLFRSITNLFPNLSGNLSNYIEIIHVYGMLGDYNRNSENFNPYRPIDFLTIPQYRGDFRENSWESYSFQPTDDPRFRKYDEYLFRIINEIKTFTEVVDQRIKEKIQSLLIQSDELHFMGFSFGDDNVDLLFKGLPNGTKIQRILGTAYNFTPEEIIGIQSKITGLTKCPAVLLKNMKVHEYIKLHNIAK